MSTVLAAISLALFCASPADAATPLPSHESRTISVTGSEALGGYTTLLGQHPLPPYVAATQAWLGRPASVRNIGFKRDPECQMRWPTDDLTATFYHGYGGVLHSCAPRAGTLRIEFGRGWSTEKGLAVGATVADLRQDYPRAMAHGSAWTLIGSPTPWNSTIVVLGAEVRDGRVIALVAAGPEAWDE